MQLPFFYIENFDPAQTSFTLNEDNSRHIIQVLRMQLGEALHLTDGNGHLITATIATAHKKHCQVQVDAVVFHAKSKPEITIALSLLKNNNRFEWFLEKATEIGMHTIVPLLCERTEKQQAKMERLQNILISAMLQSRQVWLPVLHLPVAFTHFIAADAAFCHHQKWVAHCRTEEKTMLKGNGQSAIILIGPEGDFTPDEIALAIQHNYQPASLGNTRLRTETAGVVAATLLRF